MEELNNLFLSEGTFLPKFSVDLSGYDFASPAEAILSPDIDSDNAAKIAEWVARSGEFDTLLLVCMDADPGRSQSIVQGLAHSGFLTQVGIVMKGGGINVAKATEDAQNDGFFTKDTDVSIMLYRPKKSV